MLIPTCVLLQFIKWIWQLLFCSISQIKITSPKYNGSWPNYLKYPLFQYLLCWTCLLGATFFLKAAVVARHLLASQQTVDRCTLDTSCLILLFLSWRNGECLWGNRNQAQISEKVHLYFCFHGLEILCLSRRGNKNTKILHSLDCQNHGPLAAAVLGNEAFVMNWNLIFFLFIF